MCRNSNAREPYEKYPALESLYLEDSYVLGIEESSNTLVLLMEFVLRESHELWQPLKPGEQYCYRKGRLEFQSVRELAWLDKHMQPNTDANGEIDFGNIDVMRFEGGHFELEGDWGRLKLACEDFAVHYDSHEY